MRSASLALSVLQLLSATTSMNNHAGKKPTKRTSVFDKGQVICLHRARKSAKEVSQMIAIELRTVQITIAVWKRDGEVHHSVEIAAELKL